MVTNTVNMVGNMDYRIINGKAVITKDGVHFSVTAEQAAELQHLLVNIIMDLEGAENEIVQNHQR